MIVPHPQETILQSFDCKGVTVDLVEWTDTTWCGKIGYAANNADEPDVDLIMTLFQALDFSQIDPQKREHDWDACLSVNYFSSERPNGVMFGFLVTMEPQSAAFDLYRVLAAQYMRIRMDEDTARLLGHDLWRGGIPPYEWIGEEIAPMCGYQYGDDSLPVFEYYGHFCPEKNAHEFCYLYVPVKEGVTSSQ